MRTQENKKQIMTGNEAVAWAAYKMNEFFPIYPITPATNMSELVAEWQSQGIKNIWGEIPVVQPMQGEGGVAGALHGAIQTGTMSSTFTASQGLLLMVPNLYKIAGELTPTVLHVATRSIAIHALSVYSDHSDVMAARATGCALLNSTTVQEAMDFAVIAQAATLRCRIPFIHFFDGFRTSHESRKIEVVSEDIMRAMMDEQYIRDFKDRSLSPDHPFIRGSAQGPDVFFQSREATNKYYSECIGIVQKEMQKFEVLTGRRYSLFEYEGHPQAEKVVVAMGASASTIAETVKELNRNGDKCGVLKVRLFRPFNQRAFLNALPPSCRSITVMDKTKEPGSSGEPLYLDVVQSFMDMLNKNNRVILPQILGGRYGLGSKEFTPAMVKAVFDNMNLLRPKNHFTIGIEDDVSYTSLPTDEKWHVPSPSLTEILHVGYQDDGMKKVMDFSKSLAEESYLQEYSLKEAKKFKTRTESNVRLGKDDFEMPYRIVSPDLMIVRDKDIEQYLDKTEKIKRNGTILIATSLSSKEVIGLLPKELLDQLEQNIVNLYTIDLRTASEEDDVEGNTEWDLVNIDNPNSKTIRVKRKDYELILYVIGLAVSGILLVYKPFELASYVGSFSFDIADIEKIIENAVNKVDLKEEVTSLSHTSLKTRIKVENEESLDLVKSLITGKGNTLPVSSFPIDGTYPSGTSKLEKMNFNAELPEWEKILCTQCGNCAMVCPHAAIRIKVYDEDLLKNAPSTFQSANDMNFYDERLKYTIQIAPDDCTGCGVCVEACPSIDPEHVDLKALIMKPKEDIDEDRANFDFFLSLPEYDRNKIDNTNVAQQQIQQPLFEFPGACAGCGETPYLKLLSQLFGDRSIIANATGCSSIYGGYLPTTPWTKNNENRGPAWSNSLYEDNAEFGLGFKLSVERQRKEAKRLLQEATELVGQDLVEEILNNDQENDKKISKARKNVSQLKNILAKYHDEKSTRLSLLADYLVKKSIWIVGGDGWAYDIGFGGLDHVLALGENVNILVLDNEVYANTGGQMSKATRIGTMAKFAPAGKKHKKKDLVAMAQTYDHVFVASVALGADQAHTLRTFVEADRFDGPSLIVAYSHCVEQGIDMKKPLQTHKNAVAAGNWRII